jgi:hypothetical protein
MRRMLLVALLLLPSAASAQPSPSPLLGVAQVGTIPTGEMPRAGSLVVATHTLSLHEVRFAPLAGLELSAGGLYQYLAFPFAGLAPDPSSDYFPLARHPHGRLAARVGGARGRLRASAAGSVLLSRDGVPRVTGVVTAAWQTAELNLHASFEAERVVEPDWPDYTGKSSGTWRLWSVRVGAVAPVTRWLLVFGELSRDDATQVAGAGSDAFQDGPFTTTGVVGGFRLQRAPFAIDVGGWLGHRLFEAVPEYAGDEYRYGWEAAAILSLTWAPR